MFTVKSRQRQQQHGPAPKNTNQINEGLTRGGAYRPQQSSKKTETTSTNNKQGPNQQQANSFLRKINSGENGTTSARMFRNSCRSRTNRPETIAARPSYHTRCSRPRKKGNKYPKCFESPAGRQKGPLYVLHAWLLVVDRTMCILYIQQTLDADQILGAHSLV